MPTDEVLCVGELLWDALPAGLFLGGAPFNVACHLSATGFVSATIDDSGQANFVIVDGVAWDTIEPNEALLARAEKSRAIVFGSLAQRHATTRRTIERLWESKALMVFDLNLRPPFEDREVIRRSLQRADVVKVTREELQRLASWFELPHGDRESASALSRLFSCPVVCVTRGPAGAALWRDDTWTEHPGFEVEVRDTVGAGDAFLAVLLAGLLSGADSETLLKNANRIGAQVVTQVGALPAGEFSR